MAVQGTSAAHRDCSTGSIRDHMQPYSCLLHDFGQNTDLEVEVAILNLGEDYESKLCSSAWSTTTRNEAKIPTGVAHNKQILQLSTSSSFPRLYIGICQQVSKHKGSSNPNPTASIHMNDKLLHTMTLLPKATIALTLIASVWNEVSNCCSGSGRSKADNQFRESIVTLMCCFRWTLPRDNGEQPWGFPFWTLFP